MVAEEWPEVEDALRAADSISAQGDPTDEVRLLTSRAFLNLAQDRLVAWQRDFEDAAGTARMNGDAKLLAYVLTSYAVGARKLGRFDVALDAFREAAATRAVYGTTYLVTFARLGCANVLYLTGELRASRAEMLEILADEHEAGTIRILIAQFGVALAIALRDDALAARCYERGLLDAAFATNEPIQYAPLAAAVAELHLANREDEAAAALLSRMLSSLPAGWSDCEVLLPVAVCCAPDEVMRARARFDEAAAATRNPFADAYRQLFEAYAAARFGSREEKLRCAQIAASMLHRLRMPLLEAEAYELAEQPARAIAICETIGALRLPRRIGPRPKRRSATTQLTAREREIVDVALRGLPNSAIAGELSLSERTVEAHLAAAYRKLGVRSRGELISVLRKSG
jgi:DNA-binding CsgD family transcriptional regulator